MNERNKLLGKISSAQFALWELHMYLDTHPCDLAATEMCEKYKKETDFLINEYEKNFGPLYSDNCENCNWISEPWPWERGNN